MSDARMTHEALVEFAQVLAENRDEAIDDQARYPYSAEFYAGRASGYRRALASLHIWSDGAYGQTVAEQRGEVGK